MKITTTKARAIPKFIAPKLHYCYLILNTIFVMPKI